MPRQGCPLKGKNTAAQISRRAQSLRCGAPSAPGVARRRLFPENPNAKFPGRRRSANSQVLRPEDALQTMPARGGGQLADNRHRPEAGQKRRVSPVIIALQPAAPARSTTSRRTAQAGPAPRPPSGRMRMYARIPPPPRAQGPRPAACAPPYLRAPMFLSSSSYRGVWSRTRGAGTAPAPAAAPPIRRRKCPCPDSLP